MGGRVRGVRILMAQLSTKLPYDQMLTKWAVLLNPILSSMIVNGSQLTQVKLISGSNSVNHGLGRNLQGWFIVRKRQFLLTGTPTAYDIYDTQDSNQMPQLTLNLTCSQGTSGNPVLVDIWVY
jgi:hypothetical protein